MGKTAGPYETFNLYFVTENRSTMNHHLTTEQKVDAIYRLLKGDKELDPKDEGLVGDVHKISREVKDLQHWRIRTVAWAVGVAFGGGALTTFVLTVILKK